jgi:hypothetical protein
MKRAHGFGLVLLIVTGLALAQSLGDKPYVEVAPVAKVTLRAGSSANVDIDFRVRQDFHINSHTPKQEYLIPTLLKLNPTQQVAIADVKYPAGEEMSFAFSPNDKLSVYSGDFRVTAVLKAPANVPPGNYAVKGELKFQACDRTACYPPNSLPVQFQVSLLK